MRAETAGGGSLDELLASGGRDGSTVGDTPCVVCGDRTELVIEGLFDLRFGVPGRYGIRRCVGCTLEQTSPRLAAADLAETYERYYNFRDSDSGTYGERREALIRSGLYRLWVRIDGDISFVRESGGGRRLLDVGCNEGRNLALFRRQGFRAEGVEPNPAAVASARRQGLTVFEGSVHDVPREAGPFDVVVLSNVLEHVENPVQMLREVCERLAPGGEVWISCPNASSWARRVFGRSWINWHPPFHLVHFSRRTLSESLSRAGFEVASVETRTPALWLAQSALARRYAKAGRPTLEMRRPGLLGAALVLIRGALSPLLWLGDRLGRGDCLLVRAVHTETAARLS